MLLVLLKELQGPAYIFSQPRAVRPEVLKGETLEPGAVDEVVRRWNATEDFVVGPVLDFAAVAWREELLYESGLVVQV